jgi:hypothetical protein
MPICDLHSGHGKLVKSAKRLRDQWELTKGHWTDQNAADFERHHLQVIMPLIAQTSAAVNQFGALLLQMERDCIDEDQS